MAAVKSRLFTLLVWSLLSVGVGGCENFKRTYWASGRLIDANGSPAAGVRVLADGPMWWRGGSHSPRPAGPTDLKASDDYIAEHAVETDRNGYFSSADFPAADLITEPHFGPQPEPPLLPEVYIWVLRHEQWVPLIVPVDASAQKEIVHSGREVRVGTVVVPSE